MNRKDKERAYRKGAELAKNNITFKMDGLLIETLYMFSPPTYGEFHFFNRELLETVMLSCAEITRLKFEIE